jgi:hypothetical protein
MGKCSFAQARKAATTQKILIERIRHNQQHSYLSRKVSKCAVAVLLVCANIHLG